MGDYFRHWLEMGRSVTKPPRIFRVNWFRTDDNGKFLWPGFGENLRVVKWIFDRCDGGGKGAQTPIGIVPTLDGVDRSGINVSDAAMEILLKVDPADWAEAAADQETFLASLGAPMSFLGLIEGSADALSSLIKMAAGKLSDRGPRRTLVASGYAMPAIARALIAAAMAPWQVLGARLFDRTGKGIRSGPRDALIADSVAPSQRGRAFGLNRSMDHFGAAVGIPNFAFAQQTWPTRSVRYMLGFAAGIAIIALISVFSAA